MENIKLETTGQKRIDTVAEDIKKLMFEEAQILFPNYFKASGTT